VTAVRTQPPLRTNRDRLLAGLPVTERQLDAAAVPTAVLEGGDGPPVVLLHGPGESAVNWRWTMPDVATTHRVVAPDLPAHGSSGTSDSPLDTDLAVAWLDDVVERTCAEPPIVVGHVLGGAIAARYAARRPGRLRGLVLVDSLGLARFRPSLRFALGLLRFTARPSERSFELFMDQCAHDRERLQQRMGGDWAAFVAYNLGLARSEHAKAAGQLLRRAGTPRIPPDELDQITVPVTLIWGRHDRALRLRIAERASARRGWPLHVIDDAADDPARDQPEAFLRALRSTLPDLGAET
jgi:pimeloyl-ACP methyl ester carboxylesterase